jgi:hypothetical protein
MAGEDLDLAGMIKEFVSDPQRSSLELPHMTTGQRKQTKKIVDEYPEITCESFGFGQERRLHLFKQPGAIGYEHPNVRESEEAVPVDTLGSTTALHCIMEGAVCKLDLSGINAYRVSQPECSTASPSSNTSEGSPASTFREMLPPWLAPPPGLEIRNTFVHFNEPPVDQRAVQSMPHNMFRQSLAKEAMSAEAINHGRVQDLQSRLQSEEHEQELAPGTTVIIHGLQKCPAFNGLKGTVQSLDVEACRYTILFSAPVGGHSTAKVKRENLKLVSVGAGHSLFATSPMTQLASRAPYIDGTLQQHIRPSAHAHDGITMAALPLKLTALV